MSDEPYIKRELESPTPKRQRLSVVSNAQDMFDLTHLMHQYSPPPASGPHVSPPRHHHGGRHRDREQRDERDHDQPRHPQTASSNNERRDHIRRRPTFSRWERNAHGIPPRSPARLRSPYPPGGPNHHHPLRRSPHHGHMNHGLRRSNRHRGGHWHQNQDQHEVRQLYFSKLL